jgi:hypothetical protein
MSATRERIVTDNEQYGGGVLASDEGGAWIVRYPDGNIGYVATNRQAMEDAVYAKAAASGIAPTEFTVEVWSLQDHYPNEDDD